MEKSKTSDHIFDQDDWRFLLDNLWMHLSYEDISEPTLSALGPAGRRTLWSRKKGRGAGEPEVPDPDAILEAMTSRLKKVSISGCPRRKSSAKEDETKQSTADQDDSWRSEGQSSSSSWWNRNTSWWSPSSSSSSSGYKKW